MTGAARTLAHLSSLSARLLVVDERTAKAAIDGLNRAGGRTRELEHTWLISGSGSSSAVVSHRLR